MERQPVSAMHCNDRKLRLAAACKIGETMFSLSRPKASATTALFGLTKSRQGRGGWLAETNGSISNSKASKGYDPSRG